MSKINTSQLLQVFKADLKAADSMRKEIDAKIQEWKDAHDGKPYGNEEKNKSAIVSRDIKKQSEWQHASILDPFVATQDIVKIHPITAEDVESARQSEIMLNAQFCRQFPRYSFMTKAIKVLDREGTVVVKTGWDYEDEEIEVDALILGVMSDGTKTILGTQKEKRTKVLVNKPTAQICRNEDVYIDPTCQDDMDKCQFVIHRYETDLSTLKQDGRYKNLRLLGAKSNTNDDGSFNGSDYDPEDNTNFRFTDNPRKKLLVYEYWGNYDMNGDGIAEPVVCAWVNDVVIRLQSNPYPDKKPPFLVVPFNSVPFQMYGESNAELIGNNQKVKTAITRGIIDNMAKSNNAQKGVRKGALDTQNRRRFLQGEDFVFNGTPADFWDGSYNQIPGSAFNMLQMMDNEIESITGTKSFSQGISGNSLGSGSATAARGVIDSTAMRRTNVVRNIAEHLIKPLMRKWLAYDSEFLDEEEVVRYTNDKFVQIRRDDLSGKFDLSINVATVEANSAKSQELTFMMQTMAQSMSEEMKYKILAQWADLTKQPELAKEFRSFQPKPDPVQEELKQLALQKAKLENEKLLAEIENIKKMALENEADQREKIAQAKVKEAQARKLNSDADMTDLNFVKTNEQIDHQEKVELEQLKHDANMQAMMLQKQAGDKNIGVEG